MERLTKSNSGHSNTEESQRAHHLGGTKTQRGRGRLHIATDEIVDRYDL